jgi:D-glycero-alpha-D-manno-heptose 1-phosphate guanylyltransferase
MALISGKPFLERQLTYLQRQRFTDIVLAVGYKKEVIINYFGDTYHGLRLWYSQETTALGTGGALRQALSMCRGNNVFIFNGDTYVDANCDDIIAFGAARNRNVIVGGMCSHATRYGRLVIQNGDVAGLDPPSNDDTGLINTGCYYVSKSLLSTCALENPFSFEYDFLADFLPTSPFVLYVASGLFIDIGVPDDFRRAQSLFS